MVVFAVLAAVSAEPLRFGLGAPLLGRVSQTAPDVTNIHPETTVQEQIVSHKAVPVPVPVPQPYLTEPNVREVVHPGPVVQVAHQPVVQVAHQPVVTSYSSSLVGAAPLGYAGLHL